MSISFNKFVVTGAKPHCCGLPMHRAPKFVLLREPPIAFRLMGYTCQACQRVGVSSDDLDANQHRALRAAKLVRTPGDLFRLIKTDMKGKKDEG